MKGSGKILLGCALVTLALLLYVGERIEMIRASYRIHDLSRRLSSHAEAYRQLKFDVAQRRSPQSLEMRLKELSLPLTLPKQIQVLRVPETNPDSLKPIPLTPSPSNRFFDFIGQWMHVAQARTEQ